ncbi:MAG: PEP/pyruvate-binding domain-containing protein [Elusimicrobia bacterium]|nr:PEP/pyruvate-binding domain-containing protein [Candidatus Liberimonas magnetica]
MSKIFTLMSTGLPELDKVIQGVQPGDNIVWQLDSIEDYKLFVHPFCRDAYDKKNKLIYFRFAQHESLLPEGVQAQVYELHPEDGFETFIAEIFKVIEKNGLGAFYVFDCLSELTVDWYSDRMLANFFMLACPYLYDYDTATYFALLRNHHTTQTVNVIHNTAQVIIDVYRNKKSLYLQPIKVYKRHSHTMYMLHHWKDGKFHPETRSAVISEILEEIYHPWLDISISRQDMWPRIFAKARELQQELAKNRKNSREEEKHYNRLIRMVVTRDEPVLKLAEKYFDLEDLIDIGKHMVGTGLIGGKTVGMLLARAILKKSSLEWRDVLEPHDSFFIGSDVFYTYVVQNGCWWFRWKQRYSDTVLEETEEARKRMLDGKFPQDIEDQFKEILNYFGQSPIIVRSSSLLEDAYGNAFSGKYESVFCANQGTPEDRLKDFTNAVKTVYASTMSRDALTYRLQRGLLDRDEQMALLVQRVSGSICGNLFFPHVAGVGFSYNPYVWSKAIDPKAGVLRLVLGLGTRAVDRSGDDYTRIVALNDPVKKPAADFEEARKYTQKKMDLLDLASNKHVTRNISELVKENIELPLEMLAERDLSMEERAKEAGLHDVFSWVFNFDNFLSKTDFPKDMNRMLSTLNDAYDYPVDIEFTANIFDGNKYKVNLLQCRPFQVKKEVRIVKDPGKIPQKDMILKTSGPIIGSSIQTIIDRIIYVVPSVYGKLPENERYQVANVIGKVTNLEKKDKKKIIMLIGPGRWGTTTPSLGVPVQFGDINNVSVLCEMAEMHEGLVPDVSLGTHFFNDLVELDMLYLAVYPQREDNFINKAFLENANNRLLNLVPEAGKWKDAVRVIDLAGANKEQVIYLNVNSTEQKGVCYIGAK